MKLNNKYYILRHGQALSNVKGIASSWPEKFKNILTEKGKEIVEKVAETLKNTCAEQGRSINIIFTSDLLRAKQTAEIVGEIIKVKPENAEELREIDFGILNGKPLAEWEKYFNSQEEKINNAPQGAETYKEVSKRIFNFFSELDHKYIDKNILLVSHECPLTLLEWKVKGLSLLEGIRKYSGSNSIKKGELRELNS